ncbi:type I secretion C-terminal target domain-containing protein [Kiloniella majae]|uniref:type I secretion C-terminal target domain-containing protein n=1 Tax=Kiloniella majae TaxID=1938558 RepID=UPI000A279058|nr:type I secretion C-terminal target domain-containing protein [Kiloniella majae]
MVSVLATQTRNDDWPLYTAVRGAEVYAESVGKSVAELFDEISTTWYFGGGFGSPAAHGGFAEQVIDWISTFGEARAKDMIFEQLSGTAQHVDMTGQPDWASPPTIQTALDYIRVQAEFAEQYGWTVNSYEGGSHMVSTTTEVMDALSEFFQDLHLDPRMGDLYAQVYEGWLDIEGTTLFNQFQEVGVHSNWGSFSALQDLLDNSPRWDALKEFNEEAPDWAQRPEGTFDQGVRVFGTEAPETLTGTVEEDFLIAGGGDDILLGNAGDDGLHGGAGDDVLISGRGSDTVLGGSGADRFVFNSLDQGQDVIRGFNHAEGDTLDLSDLFTFDNDDTIILENYIRLDEVDGDTVLMINSTGNQQTEYQAVARLEGIIELGSIDDLVQNEVLLITD